MKKSNRFEKILALVLTLILVLGMAPPIALAEGNPPPVDDVFIVTPPEEEPPDDTAGPETGDDQTAEPEGTGLEPFSGPVTALNASDNEITDDFDCPDFLARVRSMVGKPEPEPILESDVSGITELWIHWYGITSLAGIEHFASLEYLYASGNQITDLDLSNNSALIHLDISDNELSSLNVSGNTALKHLDISYNEIASLNVSSLTALESLNVYSNELTTLNVSGITSLRTLNIGYNEISSLTLSGLTALAELYASGNLLTTLNVSGNTALKHLDISNNKIASLSLSTLTALSSLDVSGNLLTTLNVSGNTDLRQLNIDYNKIASLSLSTLTALEQFHASGNLLTTLNVNSNTALQDLDISNNEIASLSVSNLTALEILNVNDNRLESLVLSNNTALWHLRASYNQLKSLDVSKNTSLRVLDISGNGLTSLDVSDNASLETLYIDNNKLTTLDLSNNNAVSGLFAYSNLLTGIELSINANYEFIDIRWNRMDDITAVIGGDSIDWDEEKWSSEWEEYYTPFMFTPQGRQNAWDNVIFEDWNGDILDKQYVEPGEYAIPPTQPSRPGFNFIGWSDDYGNTTYSPDSPILIEYSHTYMFIAMYSPVDDDIITIPDVNFRREIKGRLGIPERDDIWLSDVINIRELYVDGWGITSLEGIGYFESLREFTCWGLKLTELDMSGNPALKRLRVNRSMLTKLDVSENKLLEGLDCNYNLLTELDLSGNPNLRYLHCSNNRLTGLDLSGNPNLQHLYCNNNRLTSLDLTGNPIVNSLKIQRNRLPNTLEGAKSAISGFDALEFTEWYDGEGNILENPELLPQNVFTGTEGVVEIPDPNFLEAVRLYTGKAVGPIQKSDVFDIAYLDVSHRNISSLEGIEHFTGLVEFDFFSNNISSLNVSANVMLERLNGYNNRLTALDVSKNPALNNLDIDYNRLLELDVSENKELEWLYVSGNLLTSLNVAENSKLKYLYASYNRLTSVTLRANAPYEQVDLSNNRMQRTSNITNGGGYPWDRVTYCECCNSPQVLFSFSPQIDTSRLPTYTVRFEDWDGTFIGSQTVRERDFVTPPAGFAGTLPGYKLIGWTLVDDWGWSDDFDIHYNEVWQDMTLVAKYGPITDSVVNIPDPNFEKALREHLDMPTGDIMLSHVVNITYLYIEGMKISDLTGIEHFKFLRGLYCNDNNLTSLDLSGNAALRRVYAARNRLTSLDVSQNGRLMSLDCSYNRLEALDVSGKPNLEYLYVNHNLLTGLALAGSTKIEYIQCHYNLMPNINAVTGISTRVRNNMGFLPQRSAFTGADGPVTIPDGNFRAALEDIMGKAPGAPILRSEAFNIDYLNITDMGIADLTGIESFRNIEWLDVSDNELATINVSGNTSLYTLYIRGNRLTSIDLSGNMPLSSLDVSDNNLTTLNLSKNTYLGDLNASGNRLTSLNLGTVRWLYYLNVSNNRLASLDVTRNTQLSYLAASNNRLSSIDITKNVWLHQLNVSHNLLSSIDVSKNTRLEYIDLSHNGLTRLALISNRQYWTIDVRYNNMPNKNAITGGRSGPSGGTLLSQWDEVLGYYEDDSEHIPFRFTPQQQVLRPTTPVAPVLAVNGPFAVTLTWAAAEDATSYELYRRTGTAATDPLVLIKTFCVDDEGPEFAASPSWTDNTIEQNTRYGYTLVVKKDSLRSLMSAVRNMPALADLNKAVAPAAPTVTGYTATNNIDPGTAQITWTASSGTGVGAPSYEVWRRAAGESEFSRIPGTLTVRTFTDSNLLPNVRYEYKIRVIWDRKDSTGAELPLEQRIRESAVRAFTSPASPSLPGVTVLRGIPQPGNEMTRIRLTWVPVIDAIGYEIFRADNPAVVKRLDLQATGTVEYDEWEALDFGTYKFTVRPIFKTEGGQEFKGRDVSVDVSPLNSRLARPVATPQSPYSIMLNWEAWDTTVPAYAEDATLAGYRVLRIDNLSTAHTTRDFMAGSQQFDNEEFIDTGLTPNLVYTYSIQPIWEDGGAKYFGRISATVNVTPAMQVPAVPAVSLVGPTEATFSWLHIPGVKGYKLLVPGLPEYIIDPDAPGVLTGNTIRIKIATNLTPNTAYLAHVRAFWKDTDPANLSGEIHGGYSGGRSFTTTGPAPGSLVAVNTKPTSTSIGWNHVNPFVMTGTARTNFDADGYIVYKNGVFVTDIPVISGDIKTTYSYVDPAILTPGTPVTYTVRAYWENDGVKKEGTASTRTVTPPGPAPGGVTNETGKVIRPDSFTIQWTRITGTANLEGFLGYKVFANGVEVGFVAHDRLANPTRYYLPTSAFDPLAAIEITPFTTYRIEVYGVWEAADGITAVTGSLAGTGSIRTAGPAPGGLVRVANQSGPTTTTIRWNRVLVNPEPDGYIVYRDGIKIGDVEAPIDPKDPTRKNQPVTYTLTDPNVTPGVAYRYTVRAYWQGDMAKNEGDVSTTLSVTPPGNAPGGVTGVAASATRHSITVRWNLLTGASGTNHYKVYLGNLLVYSDDPTDSVILSGLTVARNANTGGLTPRGSVIIGGLAPNTQYRVRVSGVWDAGEKADPGWVQWREGRVSGNVNASTANPVARSLAAAAGTLTSTGVRLTWNDAANNTNNVMEIEGWLVNKDSEPYAFIPYGLGNAASRQVNVTDLTPGVDVRFTVQALWDWHDDWPDMDPEDAFAAISSGDIGAISNIRTVRPTGGAPGGIRTTGTTATNVKVDWTGVADAGGWSVKKYNVRLLLGNEVIEERLSVVHTGAATSRQSAITFTDSEIRHNTTYRVQIEPIWTKDTVDRPGRSSFTNIKTLNSNVGTPTNQGATSARVTLRWNDLTNAGAAGYLVRRGTTANNMAPYAYITAGAFVAASRLWADNNIQNPGTALRYTVQVYWGAPADIIDSSGILLLGGVLPAGGKPGATSAARSVTPPGPAPTTPAQSQRTSTSVKLTWNLAAHSSSNLNNNINAFLITKTVSGSAPEEIRVARVNSTPNMRNGHTWVDTNLNPGVAVSYRVQSLWGADIDLDTGEVTGGRAGLRSAARSVTANGGAAPGGVKGTVNSPTQMTVTWNAITAATAGGTLHSYDVLLYQGSVLVREASVSITEPRGVVFNNLSPNVQYSVRVRGVWNFGTEEVPVLCHGAVKAVNVRTSGPAPSAAPTVVSGTNTGTSLRLRWNAVAQADLAGYRITKELTLRNAANSGNQVTTVWFDSDGKEVAANTTGATAWRDITVAEYIGAGNGWVDNNLRPGVQARYRVQALWEIEVDNEGVKSALKLPGAYSARRDVTPSGGVPGTPAGTVTPTTVTATWSAVSNNVSGSELVGYRVELWSRTSPQVLLGASNPITETNRTAARTYTFDDAKLLGGNTINPRTNYQIRVVAVWKPLGGTDDTIRDGRVSANRNVTTTGPAPGAFTALNVKETEAQLAWNPVAGALGYRITRTVAGVDTVAFISNAVFTNTVNSNTWTDKNLEPGVAVRYSIQAIWAWDDDWASLGGEAAAQITNSKPGTATSRITVTPPRP